MYSVTCIAPVNIAVIKYWGKRDSKLILPLNDSISATLCTDHMNAKTTVMASPTFEKNQIWLNGTLECFDNPRLINCLHEIKKRARKIDDARDLLSWNIHVCSENNFPTAAGLASSAAGYACLVFALAKLYGVEDDLSSIARQGSGSACRSVFGGFVQWHAGSEPTGIDSIATQIAPETHWPEMRIIVLVVNDQKKNTSSTGGMERSVNTSELLKYRVKTCVPEHIRDMNDAIKERDFQKFAEITMRDSNQFHAVCLDTYPPCVYMTDVSHSIVGLIHKYNSAKDSLKVAYTFDAGPNCSLYILEQDVPELLTVINAAFPPAPHQKDYIKGIQMDLKSIPDGYLNSLDIKENSPGLLKYVIHTKVGEGPKVLTEKTHSLLDESGNPVNIRN